MSSSNNIKKNSSHRCRDKREDSKRTKTTNNVNDLTTALLEQPSMWMRPEFEQLRNFVETAPRNPETLPKNASAAAIVHDNREKASMPNEFVLKIESGPVCNRNDIDYDPILQVTGAPTKLRKLALSSFEHARKQVTLQASDNNGRCVTIKLASQLSDATGNLKTAAFMKSQQFQILRCSCETNSPACSAMLRNLLKIIGFSHVLVKICKLPKTK